jgi:hypothetical protein
MMGSNAPYNPASARTLADDLTTKQRLVLDVIVKGNRTPDGRFESVDLDQLLERIPYKTSKESMQFSIRSLIGRGMVEKGPQEKRRGRTRATLLPTKTARELGILTVETMVEPGATGDEILDDLATIAGN